MQQKPIRMGISDMLDVTFRLVQRNFLLFAGLAAVLEVPLSLANTLIINGFIASDLASSEQRLQDATQVAQKGASVNSTVVLKALLGLSQDAVVLLGLFMLLSLAVTGMLGAVFALAVAERFGGRPVRIGRCYALALRRLAPIAGVLILRSLLLIAPIALPLLAIVRSSSNLIDELPNADLSTVNLSDAATHDLGVLGVSLMVLMLLILIDVFLYVRWALCAQAVMLERRGLDGLSRSWRLVSGAWWKSFLVLLIGFLAVSIATRVITALDSRILDLCHLHGSARTVVQWTIDTLVAVVTLPITLSLQTLLFFDLKARHEGFNLEKLAGDLDLAASP